MNEEIMRFSSDWFYHGQVESAPQIRYRGILDYDHPIEWRDSRPNDTPVSEEEGIAKPTGTYGETFVGTTFGRINKQEARMTLDTLKDYFTKIGKQRILDERIDVGVISPYRAQVQYLRSLIKHDDFFKPYRSFISINTVDGFQGQERDIILISLVRSNDEGQIGFLRDLRRMNVAITRARMKLIILGDVATRSEEHTSELQSRQYLVCRLLLEKKTTNPDLYSYNHHHSQILSISFLRRLPRLRRCCSGHLPRLLHSPSRLSYFHPIPYLFCSVL